MDPRAAACLCSPETVEEIFYIASTHLTSNAQMLHLFGAQHKAQAVQSGPKVTAGADRWCPTTLCRRQHIDHRKSFRRTQVPMAAQPARQKAGNAKKSARKAQLPPETNGLHAHPEKCRHERRCRWFPVTGEQNGGSGSFASGGTPL